MTGTYNLYDWYLQPLARCSLDRPSNNRFLRLGSRWSSNLIKIKRLKREREKKKCIKDIFVSIKTYPTPPCAKGKYKPVPCEWCWVGKELKDRDWWLILLGKWLRLWVNLWWYRTLVISCPAAWPLPTLPLWCVLYLRVSVCDVWYYACVCDYLFVWVLVCVCALFLSLCICVFACTCVCLSYMSECLYICVRVHVRVFFVSVYMCLCTHLYSFVCAFTLYFWAAVKLHRFVVNVAPN